MSHPPAAHFQRGSFVEVDGVGADERSPVIIDNVFLLSFNDPEASPEWEYRPIRGGAAYNSPGKIITNCVASAAQFATAIRRRAHVDPAVLYRRIFLRWRLECATSEKASDEPA